VGRKVKANTILHGKKTLIPNWTTPDFILVTTGIPNCDKFIFSDTFSKLLPDLCPDSKLTKSFSCRTKTSCIIRHEFDETFDEELNVELKGTFVLLVLDESNDIDDKQLEIHVRYYN